MLVLESWCKCISFFEVPVENSLRKGLKIHLQTIALKEECMIGGQRSCSVSCTWHMLWGSWGLGFHWLFTTLRNVLICILSANEVVEVSPSFFYSIIIPLYFLLEFSPVHYQNMTQVFQNASSPEPSILPLLMGTTKVHMSLLCCLIWLLYLKLLHHPPPFAFPLSCLRTENTTWCTSLFHFFTSPTSMYLQSGKRSLVSSTWSSTQYRFTKGTLWQFTDLYPWF